MNIQIIYFTTTDWEGYHRKSMVRALARADTQNINILVINRPIDFIITPWKHFDKFKKWILGKNRYEQITPNLNIYTPLIFFHDYFSSRIYFVKGILIWVLKKQIKKYIQVDSDKLILWICSPQHSHFLKLFKEGTFVYEIYDEFTIDINGKGKKNIEIAEKDVIIRSDIVFTTSELLYHSKKKFAKNIHYIPNGISSELLQNRYLPIPENVKTIFNNIPSPRIGYIGKIRNWLDFSLLHFIATREPNFSFVFIGPIQKQAPIDTIDNLDNVYLLGEVIYEDLASYMNNMDIFIIPFKVNEFTKNCCPYKIFDYLTINKPIISTDLPEVKRFYPYIKVGSNHQDFHNKMVEAINNKECQNVPDNLIQENLWEKRVTQMLKTLYDHNSSS